MIIQVVGYGFVGQAHAWSLSEGDTKVSVYDPAKGYNNWNVDADCYIIAVSTPQSKDGTCDMNNVYETVEKIMNQNSKAPILIKSTISLEGWRLMNRSYDEPRITFSPEFLRAEHAFEDFKNQKEIMIGGGNTNFWYDLFKNEIEVTIHDPEVLILTKYMRNSFLALKVGFFNQMYDLCKASNVEATQVLFLTSEDERIGSSHTKITPERGFGGHCFPKDTSALLATSDQFKNDFSILREAVQYNERLRK